MSFAVESSRQPVAIGSFRERQSQRQQAQEATLLQVRGKHLYLFITATKEVLGPQCQADFIIKVFKGITHIQIQRLE